MERTRLFVGRSRQSPLAAIMGIWKECRLLLFGEFITGSSGVAGKVVL